MAMLDVSSDLRKRLLGELVVRPGEAAHSVLVLQAMSRRSWAC
jgi:hypothetical protein